MDNSLLKTLEVTPADCQCMKKLAFNANLPDKLREIWVDEDNEL